MKVIKPGNTELVLKERSFKCPECGCEFIANKHEYSYSGSQYNVAFYKCVCPTCGHTVFSEKTNF